jgi:hypothetical protein
MMLVDGGAVWEDDRVYGKSLVRDDAAVVDFRSQTNRIVYYKTIKNSNTQLRTQKYI